jgi:hypothetical protein
MVSNVCICHITSLSNNEFHKEQTTYLDIVDETHALSPWHLIGFLLVPKCTHSHHTHANELDIGVDDYKYLNLKCPPFHIHVHH